MDVGLTMEGKARIKTAIDGRPIFYNARGRFSRSVGVAATAALGKTLGRDLSVADVLSATGVRGIRYMLESGAVEALHLNDASTLAAKVSEENVRLNGIADRTVVTAMGANHFLAEWAAKGERFDLVDVDPFGSPAPHLDAATQAVRRGGILVLTATDLAPLCGLYKRAAMRKYGGLPIRGEFCHETAARIVLSSVVQSCGRMSLSPRVLLTVFSEHYLRVYVKVESGKASYPYREMGFVHVCPRCRHTTYSTLVDGAPSSNCLVCGSKMETSGPLWTGPLHDPIFLEQLNRYVDAPAEAKDARRLERLLRILEQENPFPPYFFDIAETCDRLDVATPKRRDVVDTLRDMGFKAVRTHFRPVGVKTNASYSDFKEAVVEALRRSGLSR